MFNQFALDGRFVFLDYYPFIKDNTYDEPIRNIRAKIQDLSSTGIGETVSREFMEEDVPSRKVRKYDTKLNILPFGVIPKTGDKVLIHENEQVYYVKQLGHGWDSYLMIHNMQFNKRKKPYVLFLGDRR